MGIIDDLFGTISNDEGSSEVSSKSKTRSTVNDDGHAEVRNSGVVINHDTVVNDEDSGHDTIFSKTTVDGKTGETAYEEGGHGPRYKK